ncbi:DmpA family aminopeptidase [Permianibacter fluminis]|uniref:DmpA family aminopeptidase n=1 Tax=Permianibacter fluminis TaxID=2738515 RepID=UPI001F352983|nr:P1 family peptidase [Permianibacter fluminis]
MGIPFDGTPGRWNTLTDVAGVTVGYHTLQADDASGAAIRTGVTAILPRGHDSVNELVYAGLFSLNGNGEFTGSHWLDESGFLEGPIMITNTHSVGVVHDAVIAWRIKQGGADDSGYWWSLPVVGETWDGWLNDINGFHVKPEHAFAALDSAHSGPLAEGNVGGGTGMICHQFKCGTGTASRVIAVNNISYTVGVLVQANYGVREELRIAGVPVGKHLTADKAYDEPTATQPAGDTGSIIIVVGTDAPLLPHQLKRLVKRAALGLARNGSYAGDGSGDIFLAFSTANKDASQTELQTVQTLGNSALDPLFLATVQATEEAIINALVAARTMTGADGHRAVAIDHKSLQKVMKQYNRLGPVLRR